MYSWKKDIASWKINNVLYLSVVFTWDLPRAKELALEHGKGNPKKVIVGGPAVLAMPDYLSDLATVQDNTIFPARSLYNPFATFTSRGCSNSCGFCTVPRIEGPLVELSEFPVLPLICDNNFLASSRKHFDRVIDIYKRAKFPVVDFNQGLDCRLFSKYHAEKLSELKSVKMRFAFDHSSQEREVAKAIELARKHKLGDITIYVLVGHEDTPEDALYRLELLRSLDVMSFPQRYQPFYSLEKNSYVDSSWTDYELKKVCTYYSNLNNTITYYGRIPYADWFNHCVETREMISRYGIRKGKKLLLEKDIPLNLKQKLGQQFSAQRKKEKTIKTLKKAYSSMATPTQKAVVEKTGISLRTVKTYWSEVKSGVIK